MSTVATILAGIGHHDRGHMDWDDGSGWWMAVIMLVSGLVIIAVIVWGVVTTTRSHQTAAAPTLAGGAPIRESSARQILDERFARGEIDAAEYEERRRLLQS